MADRDMCTTITTRQLGVGLDNFLNSLKKKGNEMGAIKVKKLPISRPQIPAAPPLPPNTPMNVQTCNAYKQSSVAGVYMIEFSNREEDMRWVWAAKSHSEIGEGMNLGKLHKLFESGLQFGPQCSPYQSSVSTMRYALAIQDFPLKAPNEEFEKRCKEAGTQHVNDLHITIATAASPILIKTTLAASTTVYFHHRGRPRHWIVIPPKAAAEFENKLASKLRLEEGKTGALCAQFVEHLRLWIQPSVLLDWGISFHEFLQEAGELVFFPPGSYFYGFSTGFSIIEQKIHVGEHWNQNDCKFCSRIEGCPEGAYYHKFPFAAPQIPFKKATNNEMAESLSLKSNVEAEDVTLPPQTKRQKIARFRTSSSASRRILSLAPTDAIEDRKGSPATLEEDIRFEAAQKNMLSTMDLWTQDQAILQADSSQITKVPEGAFANADDFFISDDDDMTAFTNSSQQRVRQLEQENGALLRNLALAQSDRDEVEKRKANYKIRLLEREELIASLQGQVRDLTVQLDEANKNAKAEAWKEVLSFAQRNIDEGKQRDD
ncbi:hypothetical protein B2J93_4711 [Marssonina coronariae]|uniref:JmjC domain-containing protein n=1 Tax=Diplocarpon coronariae TaxID=2795749 RepID=A0A218Z1B1_9HELO|nr:hypothetical protein B2J93_4711 [Marssonina coronariae]